MPVVGIGSTNDPHVNAFKSACLSVSLTHEAKYVGVIFVTRLMGLGGVVTERRGGDPKVAALRAARSLNPRPQVVRDEVFAGSEFLDARDLVQVKYEMVRRVRVEGAPVGVTAARFGFSRPSYYAAAAALEAGGLPGLVPAKPGPRRAHKLSEEVLDFAEAQLETDPGLRPADLVDPISARYGVRVHPRSIERALERRRSKSE